MKRKALLSLAITLPVLSGCVGLSTFETEPITIPTSKGHVVCQLYLHDSVTWDRSVSHPSSMSVAEADRICFDYGYELARERGNRR